MPETVRIRAHSLRHFTRLAAADAGSVIAKACMCHGRLLRPYPDEAFEARWFAPCVSGQCVQISIAAYRFRTVVPAIGSATATEIAPLSNGPCNRRGRPTPDPHTEQMGLPVCRHRRRIA